MSTSQTISAPDPTSLRRLYALFLPLALSGAFFPIARPIVSAALARTPEPELALAAFSIVLSLTTPLISPLFGMRQIVTALCVDADMVRRLGRVVLGLGLIATLPLLIVSIPTVYLAFTDRVLGIPPAIAAMGPPAMLLMSTSPLLTIGRAYYQGVLVYYDRANPIGLGAFGYLVVSTVVVFIAVSWLELSGAVSAALALLSANAIYLVIVWWPTRALYRGEKPRIPARRDSFDESKRSGRYILRLYRPLAVSATLTACIEPVIQAAMARAPDPTISLAAYSVSVSVVWLMRTHLWNMQQVVIARVHDHTSYAAVRRWMLSLSLGSTAVLAIFLWPPAGEWFFGDVIGLTGPVRDFAWRGFALLIIMPFFQGWRSLYHGTLIALGTTRRIQTAALGRAAVLVLCLVIGVAHGRLAGLYVAVGATLMAELTEVLSLHVAVRRQWARRAAALRTNELGTSE
ncbi:MAG: hypothetical protein HN404_00685 [Gemmatimonadetes bacterium]|jgi:progressive ankylosis protein|nr:hypothetical protein [Gemmatimonadota bacterium]